MSCNTRQDAYSYIKDNNLQEVVKTYFKKPYTNCSNDDLFYFVNTQKVNGHFTEKKGYADFKECCVDLKEAATDTLLAGFKKLLDILHSRWILLDSDICQIKDAIRKV